MPAVEWAGAYVGVAMKWMWLLGLSLVLLVVLSVFWQRSAVTDILRAGKAAWDHRRFVATLPNVTQLPGVQIAMPDGVRLASDIYLPDTAKAPVPVILMRLPYGKRRFGEVRKWMRIFLPAGYGVVVQDMRGRYASQGEFAPYPNAQGDGAATLDWIAAQGWSNGQVGTIGCSALGETQVMLGKARHPNHAAMIPMGAGGAIGSLGGSHGYFGFFEGGIFNLASGFGWFVAAGGKTADKMGKPAVDYPAGLSTLPARDAVARFRDDPTDFRAFMDHFGDAEYWTDAGFVTERDQFETPFLFVDGWYDGARETLQMADHMRRSGAQGHVVILPGLHCDLGAAFANGGIGDMAVNPDNARDIEALSLSVMDHHLKGAPAPDLPPVLYYMLGEDRWYDADQWPPKAARPHVLYLSDDGLAYAPPATAGTTRFVSDPADPVPTLGGNICCTGDPDLRAGPLFQNPIEGRDDLAIMTGPRLDGPLRLAGPVTAILHVSSDVPDTDLILRLTDVDPAGRSLMIQEGALRLRYRDGVGQPRLMTPGDVYEVRVILRDIAYQVPAGHRLRLHVAGSSFPRLSRNMNRGGDPYAESDPQKAEITVHQGPATPSRVVLSILPDDE